jgi:hypothetical protein
MPNLVNMEDGVTPKILNPESFSQRSSGVFMLQLQDGRHQTHGLIFEMLA